MIKKLKKDTITDAFVHYYQPINPLYKCFTVLVQAANSGKAHDEQINYLYKLKKILNKFNFSVQNFATDGDSTYQSLSVKNIEKWNLKSYHF